MTTQPNTSHPTTSQSQATQPVPGQPGVEAPGPDPTPWRHIDGERVADPFAPDSPRGGYTFDPREGYSDYPDRYISTRDPSRWE